MPPWNLQEVEQLTANVMRFMLFCQAQRPDQPVRREDMRVAMGRHQSLGVAGYIIVLAQAREPVLRLQGLGGFLNPKSLSFAPPIHKAPPVRVATWFERLS